MAARVNSRFVMILAVVLGLMFVGVALVALKMVRKTSEQLAALGDKQMAAGNYDEACKLYSKAVNKDQQNPQLIKLWIGAIQKITPPQAQAYRDRYFTEYLPALRSLAEVERTDLASHQRFLNEVYIRTSRFGAGMNEWEFIINETDRAIRNFDANPGAAKPLQRYRALARLAILQQGSPLDNEKLDQMRSDFVAALEADPADAEAAAGLADLDRVLALRARQDRDDAAAERHIAGARKTMTDFLEKQPGSAMALLHLLRLEMSETTRRAQAEQKSVDAMAVHEALTLKVLDAVQQADPQKLDISVVTRAAACALRLKSHGRDGALALVDRVLAARPDDALLLKNRADIDVETRHFEEAIAVLQKIVDLPDKPVSLDGLILREVRNSAASQQVDCVLAQWDGTTGPENRKAVIERAKGMRDAVAKRLGDQSPQVRLTDARIKYVEGDITGARIGLTSYIDRDGSKDRLAFTLLGQILRQTGDLGEARKCFQRVVELEPGNVPARLVLADLAVRMYDSAGAEAQLAAANQLDPGNKDLQESLRNMREFNAPEPSDVVLRTIREASAMAAGSAQNLPGAIEMVEKALKDRPNEMRLIATLLQFKMQNKDRAGAQALIEQAITDNPDNTALKDMREGLKYENPLDAQIATIDRAPNLPDSQRHIAKAMAYLTAGKDEESKRELEEARKADPNDRSVLELSFVEAIADKKFDEARAVAERATARNADGLNGLSYRGRLAIADGRYADAAGAFQQAVELDRLNVVAWRFLGDCRFMLRQFDEAAAAYKRGLETRPNDVPCAKGAIRSSYAANQLDVALQTARTALGSAVGMNDPEMLELYLTLEANAPGGNKARALEFRRRMLQRKPEDRPNKLALAELMIQEKEFDTARPIIDELRASATDDLDKVVHLDARLRAVRGDLPGAQKVYNDYILSLAPEKRTDEPFTRLALLLAFVGRNDEAIAALKEGIQYQDKEFLGAERQLALMYMRSNNYEEALKTLRHIISAVKSDPGDALLKAVVECQLQLKQYGEAESTMAQLGETATKDQTFLLLMARAAVGRKDLPKARRLFDQAVAAAPTVALGYLTRAEFILATDKDRLADAEADLLQALSLDSHFLAARQKLYGLYLDTGRPEQALTQLREALSADPDNDGVRATLVNTLLIREQPKAAADVIAEALKRKPDSIPWALQASDVFVKAGTPDEAVPLLRHAWELQKSVATAMAYSEVLVKCREPNLATARDVVSDKSLEPEKNFQLLLTRARIYRMAKQEKDADTDCIAGYRLVDHANSNMVKAYFDGLQVVYTEYADQVKILDKLNADKPLTEWALLNDISIRVFDKKSRPQLWPKLQAAADREDNKDIAYAANSLMANLAGEERRFEEAAAHFKRCIDLHPDQAEALNNYAYIVGEELKRPAEALPYAEKAAELAPQNSGILDSLGTLQMRLNQLEKSDLTFQRAQNIATNSEDKAPVFLHQAELELLKGNRQKARDKIDLLEEIIRQKPGLRTPYGPGIEEIKKKLAAP